MPVRNAVSKPANTKWQNRIEKKKAEGIKAFPIVGIGGSAGGLEAFSSLLKYLSVDLGMAYVYIQHLSPNHESFLPYIIPSKTTMKVVKVKNNTPVQRDHVYVIPPRYNVSVHDGRLRLTKQMKEDTIHSIDYFLNSLAPVYQQNAIGILLSGTGTDGTIALMSIKADRR